MSEFSKKMESKGAKAPKQVKRTDPVWAGPESDTDNGGITFSLLSRFLVCRERFRLCVVEGLKTADTFNHRLEFGNLWHLMEESHATVTALQADNVSAYAKQLCRRYPTQQDEISKWYNFCKLMFPIYVEYWSKHPDMTVRKPLLSEQVFKVPYQLPSGRTVYLRGKWDSVDLVGNAIWLQENKTKSDVNQQKITRQLTFDLQTQIYLVALDESQRIDQFTLSPNSRIKGVRYNVIRRPRQYQGKKESQQDFYDRLRCIVEESPDEFFMRWNVEILPADITKFRQQCLDPILEQLCDWWEYVNSLQFLADSLWTGKTKSETNRTHWRHPFGVWNILDEGGSSEVDEYLATGSEVGLQRTENLFPELTEE